MAHLPDIEELYRERDELSKTMIAYSQRLSEVDRQIAVWMRMMEVLKSMKAPVSPIDLASIRADAEHNISTNGTGRD